ncbi:dihydrofolate reductase family protein [Flavobacteriaceae bacterium F89]|uniref:Dihydrofolate reductase family protein n=1 Tax=Cerina litoralis TaxID=2874477 RepID=A0AAE3ESU5_9FLAO|nr:dihydrofolate reductase family protein [Cerina litoralis]MCG2460343.1 dihydrofolate reductase family protein [Cerina litoralis]
MKKIIYYVATSVDGFISGPDEDISGFMATGDGVARYLADLKNFKTVIMGRKTYEFGYNYGLKPGQPAYPHMRHYIFSKTLRFEDRSPQITICGMDIEIIKDLKKKSKTDIYLCGGGQFAGWLLENEMIDVLKIKLNPLILGDGIRIFGASSKPFQLRLMESEMFDDGLSIITYRIQY